MKDGMVLYNTRDLSVRDWCAFLRFYRTLRIRIPVTGDSEQALAIRATERHSGMSYGMTRDEAREFLRPVIDTVSWHDYLGSK